MLNHFLKKYGDPHKEKIQLFNELASKVKGVLIYGNYILPSEDEEFDPNILFVAWKFKVANEKYGNFIHVAHEMFDNPERLLEETSRLYKNHKKEIPTKPTPEAS